MMTPEDVKNILYRKCKEVFPDIPTYKDMHPPVVEGNVPERIVINVLTLSNEPWSKGFANINYFTPYDPEYNFPKPDNDKLQAWAKVAEQEFFSVYFNEPEGKGLYYIDNVGVEHDATTWSYFVNVRLFIQTNNFKL